MAEQQVQEESVEHPRTVFDPITIRQERGDFTPGRFRASTMVPVEWKDLPGVLGSSTENGPWVAAHAETQDAALAELMRIIGRLLVLHVGGKE